ncbi:MAG: DUF4270 domain-containing protein [Bacteroidota bacterium]
MILKKVLGSFSLIALLIVVFSCDDDFTESGSDLINSIEIPDVYEVEEIAAYSDKLNSVQTNGIRDTHFIGSYNDPVYGSSNASLLTQLELADVNHDFGQEPELDSVVLTIPLYSFARSANEYVLDSIFGNGSVRFSIYESNQYLRELNPGEDGDFNQDQRYYSDQLPEIQANIANEPLAQSEVITPADLTEGILLTEINEDGVQDSTLVSPRIRIQLPVEFFEDKIMSKAGGSELVSDSNFKEYFRGLHLVAEPVSGNGAMIGVNLFEEDRENESNNANITMFYRSLRMPPSLDPEEQSDEDDLVEEKSEFVMTLSGIQVNFYENEELINLAPQNQLEGEENLYLRGGQGFANIIELFNGPDSDNDGVSDQLQELRDSELLVNEANLIFYVNEELAGSSANEIPRIVLYDLDNERVLLDYAVDPTGNDDNPTTSRLTHLGGLSEDEDGNRFYRVRITEHINNVINNDSTNVRLGLAPSSNVNRVNFLEVKENQEGDIDRIIESALTTPRGTIFHGNQSPNEEKRLKLRIQFTEIN